MSQASDINLNDSKRRIAEVSRVAADRVKVIKANLEALQRLDVSTVGGFFKRLCGAEGELTLSTVASELLRGDLKETFERNIKLYSALMEACNEFKKKDDKSRMAWDDIRCLINLNFLFAESDRAYFLQLLNAPDTGARVENEPSESSFLNRIFDVTGKFISDERKVIETKVPGGVLIGAEELHIANSTKGLSLIARLSRETPVLQQKLMPRLKGLMSAVNDIPDDLFKRVQYIRKYVHLYIELEKIQEQYEAELATIRSAKTVTAKPAAKSVLETASSGVQKRTAVVTLTRTEEAIERAFRAAQEAELARIEAARREETTRIKAARLEAEVLQEEKRQREITRLNAAAAENRARDRAEAARRAELAAQAKAEPKSDPGSDEEAYAAIYEPVPFLIEKLKQMPKSTLMSLYNIIQARLVHVQFNYVELEKIAKALGAEVSGIGAHNKFEFFDRDPKKPGAKQLASVGIPNPHGGQHSPGELYGKYVTDFQRTIAKLNISEDFVGKILQARYRKNSP